MRHLLLLIVYFSINNYLFSQNVGIGTTTPVDKLTVQTPSSSYGITHTDGTIRLSTFLSPVVGGAWVGTVSNHPLTLSTGNTARLTIGTTGNIGVNTTTPSYPISVRTVGAGYGLVQDNGDVFVGTYAGSSSGFNAGWYGTNSNHPLAFFTNNGNAQMTLLQSGFVGIGTTAPFGALDVRRVPSSLGTAFFQGTTYGSVFNFSTNEDTYIRGGKVGGNVIINDANIGNVGVGTDSPVDKLTVLTSSNKYGLTHTDGTITVGSYVGFGAGWLGTKSNHPLYFFTNNGFQQMSILQDGRVSINGGTAAFVNAQLTVHGSVTLTSPNGTEWNLFPSGPPADTKLFLTLNNALIAEVQNDGDWVSLSDKRIKENILPYKTVLSDIKNLDICTYNFKSRDLRSRSFGLIAQNVAQYFPEIVSEIQEKDGNKLMGIAYAKTGVLALKAIQEQQEIIETLQNKIDLLEKKLDELMKRSAMKP